MTRSLPEKIAPVLADDRAVSPVVGVALLNATTAILAAIIGFVVLDTTVAMTESKEAPVTYEKGANTQFLKLLNNNDQFPQHG